jgi:hypothetical protein
MTNDTPTSEYDAPTSATGLGQTLGAALLTTAELPATTAGPVATGPKLPPFTGD